MASSSSYNNHDVVLDPQRVYHHDHQQPHHQTFYGMATDLDKFPPGYRFVPTDQEIFQCYLIKKVMNQVMPTNKIHEADIYAFSPDQLTDDYEANGETESMRYFLTERRQKYERGIVTNRLVQSHHGEKLGTWKASGKPTIVVTFPDGAEGIKRCYHFEVGEKPAKTKTDWLMNEYRVFPPQLKSATEGDNILNQNGKRKLGYDDGYQTQMGKTQDDSVRKPAWDWILCRVYKKSSKEGPAADMPNILPVPPPNNVVPPQHFLDYGPSSTSAGPGAAAEGIAYLPGAGQNAYAPVPQQQPIMQQCYMSNDVDNFCYYDVYDQQPYAPAETTQMHSHDEQFMLQNQKLETDRMFYNGLVPDLCKNNTADHQSEWPPMHPPHDGVF